MIWLELMLSTLAAAYAVALWGSSWQWHKMPLQEYEPEETVGLLPCFSIVVAARNEAQRIGPLLDSLCTLQYPAACWEMLLVDDHSEDRTVEVVRAFEAQHPELPLRVLTMAPEAGTGKKAAQSAGIEAAKHPWMALTDADCTLPPGWLMAYACFLEQHPGARLVAGPVALGPPQTLFGQWQALEFAGMMVAGAASFHQQGLFCSAANMVVHRSAYLESRSSRSDWAQASGDDVYLLHAVNLRFPGQAHFLKSTAAVVTTPPHKALRAWWRQRLRWASKNLEVKQANALTGAVLVWLLMAGMLTASVGALVRGAFSMPLLLAWGLKMAGEGALLYSASRWMAPRPTFKAWIWAQIPQTLYVSLVGLRALLGGFTWKARHYRPGGRPPSFNVEPPTSLRHE